MWGSETADGVMSMSTSLAWQNDLPIRQRIPSLPAGPGVGRQILQLMLKKAVFRGRVTRPPRDNGILPCQNGEYPTLPAC